MEDALRADGEANYGEQLGVLILVLMEDALRVLSYDWTPEEIERS